MSFYEFATNSPWLTFFLALIAGRVVLKPFILLFRHLNVRKAGWPPEHCDASGDLVQKD